MSKLKYLLPVAVACSVLSATAAKAEYPERTVKILVGFSPGGGTDALARLIASKLSEKWKQSVVVENREGADGVIASDVGARAPADGYTLIMANSNHATTPSLRKLSFDPINSFTPITNVAFIPDVLLVNPALPVNSLKELIAYAKSKPGQLNYGSTGQGSPPYLETQLLMKRAGIEMVSIAYKGSGPAQAALLGNEIQMMFGSISGTRGQVSTGSLKALAVSSAKRSPALPDVPTVAEAADLPGFDVSVWYGVLAPAGIPKEIAKKLNEDIVEVVRSPDAQKNMGDHGFITIAGTSEQFAEQIKREIPQWAELLKSLGIGPQ